jgi:hypothetical protein
VTVCAVAWKTEDINWSSHPSKYKVDIEGPTPCCWALCKCPADDWPKDGPQSPKCADQSSVNWSSGGGNKNGNAADTSKIDT